MKLRLPHRLHAALVAALASVSFTTLSTGTLGVATGAALLAGQQAQAFTAAELNTALSELRTLNQYMAGEDYTFSFTLTTVGTGGTGSVLTLDSASKGGTNYYFVTQIGNYGGLSGVTNDAQGGWSAPYTHPDDGLNVWTTTDQRVTGWITRDANGTGTSGSSLNGSTITVKYSKDTNTTTFELYHKNKATTDRVIMTGVALNAGNFNFDDRTSAGTDLVFRAGKDYVWNGTDGHATWNGDTANTNWLDGETAAALTSTGNALFTADAAVKTVTIGADVTAKNIVVQDNYTFVMGGNTVNVAAGMELASGKTLTLSGAGTLNVGGTIAGGGNIEKVGTGTLTLTAQLSNDYSGGITVSEGTLVSHGTGSNFHDVYVAQGATLALEESGWDFRFRYTLAGGTLSNIGTTTDTNHVQNDQVSLAANSYVNADSTFYMLGGSYGSTYLNLNGHTLTKTGTAIFDILNGHVDAGTIVVEGGAIGFEQTVNKNNTADVKASFVLKNAGADNLQGRFKLSGNASITALETLSASAAIELGANVTMAANVASGKTLTMSGAITGAGTIDKQGDGNLVLDGATTIAGTIANEGGNLALNGAVTLNTNNIGAFEVFDSTGQTYSYAAKGSGFLSNPGQYYLVKGTGSATASHGTSITGGSYVDDAPSKGAGDIIVTFTPAGTTYYVNQDMATTEDNSTMLGSSVKDISIKKGVTLTASASGDTFTGPAKLHGEGTYALASGAYAMNSGLTLGTDWAGTVLVSNTNASQNYQVNDVALTNGNQSTLELSGFKGWLANDRWKKEVATNIRLTDYVNGDTTRYAWVSEAYSSTSTDTMTLTGKWSGTGTYNAAGTNGGTRYMHYNFKGDITEWTGAFLKTSQNTVRTNLTFSENAKNVNIRIEGTGNFGVIVNTDATFSQTVNATTLQVEAGKTAKFNQNATFTDGITSAGTGTIEVGADTTLLLGHNSWAAGDVPYGTNIIVGENAKLDMRMTNTPVRTFSGDYTFKNGSQLYKYDGGLKYTGTTTFGLADTDKVVVSSSWAKNGVEFAGLVAGEGHLSLAGNGETDRYLFSGSNGTFTGEVLIGTTNGTTIAGNNGTAYVDISGQTALQHATVNLAGGNKAILRLANSQVTIGGLSGTAGSSISLASGTASSTLTVDGSGQYAGSIGAGISLAKAGTGTQTIGGDIRAFNGNVAVSGGTLAFTNAVSAGTVSVGENSGLTLGSGLTTTGDMTVGAGATLKFAGADSPLTVTGSLAVGDGAVFDLSRIDPASGNTVVLATYGSVTAPTGGWQAVQVANARDGYDYVLSTRAGSELVLTMSPWVGRNLIWNGEDGAWSNDANWHLADQTPMVFRTNDNVTFDATSVDTTATLSQSVSTGTVTVNSDAKVTIAAANAGNTLTIGGAATVDGDLTIKAAVVTDQAVTIGQHGTLTLGGAEDSTLSGAVSGSGDLVKTGEGTAILSGNNQNFTGDLTISGGTVKAGNNLALGRISDSRSITVAKGGTLDVNGTQGTGAGYTIELAGGTLTNTVSGLDTGKRQLVTHATLTQDSTVDANVEFGITGSNYAGTRLELRTHTLEKIGNAMFTLSNTEVTGSGKIKVSQGTLNFQKGGAYASNLEMAGGTVTGTINLANNTTVTGTGNGGTISAVITGAGYGVTKDGAGTVTLSGNNTYSGGTTVTAGTLRTGADNVLGSGAVAVNAGGTLDVYGHAVTNAVTVNGGALTNGSSTAMGVDTPGLASLTVGSNGMTVNGGRAVSVHSATGTASMTLGGTATIDGSGTQLVLGDATLTGTGTISTTNNGALGVGGTTIASGSDVSIGTSTTGAHVFFYDTLVNKSANTDIYGAKLTYNGDLASNVEGGAYKDTVATEQTGNGFLQGGYFTLVDNQDGGAVTGNLVGSTITANGFVHTLRQTEGDDKDIVFDLMEVDINSVSDTYFINSGTLTYNAADNATGLDRVSSIRLNGGNLQLTNTDLKTDVTLDVQQDGTVNIGTGRTLYENTVNVATGEQLTLTGAGTFVMSPCTLGSNASLPAGVVLGTQEGDEFTGTVWLSKGTKLIKSSLTGLATDNSSVTFNGVTGSLATGEIAQNIVLVDYNSIPALALTNGTDGETRTFSGTITGDGTLARSFVSGDGNKGGIQNYEFTGDVSNWNGIFDNQVNGETTNLTFSGAVAKIGATIMNGPANSAGTLNVSTAGEKAKVFNQAVTASSFSAQGGNVDFMEVVNLTGNASASGGTVLTFHDSASIGGTLSGNVTVADGGNVTVAGAATLGNLDLIGTSTTRLNGAVSASGEVTVGNNASLYLNGGGITLGDGASLTVSNGAKIGLTGWSASTADHTESGVKTTGFTGGQLFSVAEGGSATVTVNPITIVMKDGAEFKYTTDNTNRVTVHTDSTQEGYGTVDIIEAVYYYVAASATKSMDNVIAEAAGSSLDYILIDNGGKLSGVTDANKSTYGISGLQGGGTIAVGTGGTLTDSAALEAFAGNILVDPNSTFETNGSVARTLKVNGGTLHATDNMTLGDNATFTNSGSDIPTVDVDANKTLEIVNRMSASLEKTGDGTLRITDTYPLGSAREPMISGDLVVKKGTVVLNSLHRTVREGDNKGIVAGNITMAGGTDLVFEGIDPLGHSDTATQKITLKAGTEDNLTTMLFTRNGGDSETTQHLTLTTQIEVQGNTLIGGLNLNSYGRYREEGLGEGSYIHASGTNNVIDNTFALRKNAYFDVDLNSELTLTGDMLKFTGSAAVTNPMVIKTGEGLLDLAGENSSLYAINTKEGKVDVSGHVTFTGTAENQFLMNQGAVFAVNNGGLFEYRDWDFENNDGTPAPGTITAMGNAQNFILQNEDLEVSGMKLTNHNGDEQIINAKLDNVQLVQNGGAGSTVVVADASAGTQHISKLTAATGTTVLNNATLDSATVSDGATLTLSPDKTVTKTVTLGSTIRNGGTVNLNGIVNVENLAGFAAQSGAGYQDVIIDSSKQDSNNGFYQGNTYYLVKEEGTSTLDVSENFSVKYQGNDVYAKGQESDHGSYYFEVHVPNALYYINNTIADAVYTSADDAGNSMYKGYMKGAAPVNTSGIVMNVNGAVLTLASGLRDEVRTTTEETPGSGIVANYNGTVKIQEGVILHQSDLSGKDGVLVALVGQGTFDLDGTTLKSVSSGLTEGGTDQWHGTVRASGTADEMDAAHMGNVTSTLLFDGVKGTLESGAADETIEYTMKIALQNRTGQGDVTYKALDNTFGSNTHRVFSNSVSGSGDILMTGENASVAQSIVFTGDVSGWVGTEQDAATFETAGQGTTNLKFSGGASEINVDINEGEGSTINLVAGPTVETQVFNGDITATSLTAEAGANTTLKNTTEISRLVDVTADDAKLHVLGTTTAGEVKVGTGSVSIQNNAGDEMATISTSTAAAGNADITGGVTMQSAQGQAILAGTAGAQPVTRVDGADIAILGSDASLKIENLVLADDTMLRGDKHAGNLVISQKVVQEMSSVNTDRGADGVVSTTALTMTGTTDVIMTFENDKVANLDFYSMCQMAQISGSYGTLVFDFTAMPEYYDWEHKFSNYGFIGVKFDSEEEVAKAFKAANQQKDAINAAQLQVVARTKDADGNLVERIGYYNNGGSGAVVGSIIYFQVPEPTTGTLSLLALAALAARRRRK